jgi:hypothetical protein
MGRRALGRRVPSVTDAPEETCNSLLRELAPFRYSALAPERGAGARGHAWHSATGKSVNGEGRLSKGEAAMAEFVVKSKVQAMVKELDMRLSGDALGVIDERVQSALKKAAKRAQANGRKTIQPQDF